MPDPIEQNQIVTVKTKAILSPFVRQKISASRMGQKPSLETRRKLSESHKGKIPWNKGKQMADETKLKIALSLTGRTHSKETIEKRASKVRAENNYNWKGGITPLNNQIRNLFEYRQWRSDVFRRDLYTCQVCNEKGGKLNADHMRAFSLIIREYNIKSVEQARDCAELWDINNGRTLCVKCHEITPNYKRN